MVKVKTIKSIVIILFLSILLSMSSGSTVYQTDIPANAQSSIAGIGVDSDPFAPSWEIIDTTIAPSPRYDHAMAFDPSRNVTLLYGGHDGTSILDDTWEFNHTSKTWKSIAYSAGYIQGAAMTYHNKSGMIYMIGGMDDLGNFLNSIYSFVDGVGWQLGTEYLADPLYRPGVAYNPSIDVIYVTGGLMPSESASMDVYEYNDTAGTIIDVGSSYGRYGHSAVYIPLYTEIWDEVPSDFGDDMLLMGGIIGSGTPSFTAQETEFDPMDNTLENFNTMGSGVPENIGSELYGIYDPSIQAVLYYGGHNDSHFINEIWITKLISPWTYDTYQMEVLNMPPPRAQLGLIYDTNMNNYLMFGGINDGSIYGDTWILNIIEPEGIPQIDSIDDCTYEQSDPNIISWNVIDTNPSRYIIYDNGSPFDQGQWSTGSITSNLQNFGLGIHEIQLWVNDTNGYYSTDTVLVTLVDTIDPVIQTPDDFGVDLGTIVSIQWNITEYNPSDYKIYNQGQLDVTDTLSGTSVVFEELLALGTHNITLLVYDTSLNSAKSTVIVTVNPVNSTVTETITEPVTETIAGTTITTTETITDIDTSILTEYLTNTGDVGLSFIIPGFMFFVSIVLIRKKR